MRARWYCTTVFWFAGCLVAQSGVSSAPQATAPWPPGTEDLPADPDIRFGRLENGLRYAWQQWPRPVGHCSLRLLVEVGSNHEGPGEAGIAHFVEHMAFNGTRRFPGNSIEGWLLRRGMRSGLHANAFTSARHTIYQLDLRTNDADSMRDGLDVLRQFADAVLFDPAEVEAEKGVIDAEEAHRSSSARAVLEGRRSRLGAGLREVAYPTIGRAAERAKFTAESLRAFHARWYRPERMILVLAGDLEQLDVEQLCGAAFGSLAISPIPSPREPDLGSPYLLDRHFALEQEDAPDVQFLALTPLVRPRLPMTRDDYVRYGQHDLACRCAQWCLSSALEQPGRSLSDIHVDHPSAFGLDFFDGMAIGFRCKPDNATAAIEALAKALFRLGLDGFSEDLVERNRRALLTHLAEGEDQIRDQRCSQLANAIARKLAEGEVPIAPSLFLALLRQGCRELDAEAATNKFKTASGLPSVLVSIGPPGHCIDGAAVWQAATELVLGVRDPLDVPKPLEPGSLPEWPYSSAAVPPANTSERTHHAASDVHDVRFANGVRLLVKRTDFRADQVQVSVAFGGGRPSVPEALRPAAAVVERCLTVASLGRLDRRAAGQLLSTRRVQATFRAEPGCFSLHGESTAADAELLFEWLHALLTDAKFDDVDAPGLIEQAAETIARFQARPLDAMLCRFAGEPIWPAADLVREVQPSGLTAACRAMFADAAVTIAVVGAIEIDAAIEDVARTFGTLPERPARAKARPWRKDPAVLREVHNLTSRDEPSRVSLFAPLDPQDGDSPNLQLLVRILRERLRLRVREELGLTYEPDVYPLALCTSCTTVVLRIEIPVLPGSEDAALSAVQEELESLSNTGVPATYFTEVFAGIKNAAADARSKNEVWSTVLSWLHERPDDVQLLERFAEGPACPTQDEFQAAVRRILDPVRISTLILRAPAK